MFTISTIFNEPYALVLKILFPCKILAVAHKHPISMLLLHWFCSHVYHILSTIRLTDMLTSSQHIIQASAQRLPSVFVDQLVTQLSNAHHPLALSCQPTILFIQSSSLLLLSCARSSACTVSSVVHVQSALLVRIILYVM